jgi:uroporphyrinogen decarboxylase
MTSKERIRNAIAHKSVDKIPVDLGGSIQTTIHAYAYAELKNYLGITDGEIEIMDTFILAAKVEDTLRSIFKVDTVPLLCPIDGLGVKFSTEKREWQMPNGLMVKVSADFHPIEQENGCYIFERNGFVFTLPKHGYYFDVLRYALQDAVSYRDIDLMFDFSGFTENEAEYFRQEAERLKHTNKAVIGDIFANFQPEDAFGYENAYLKFILDKKLVHYFVDKITDMNMRNFDVFQAAVGEGADVIMLHADMGNQNGPMFSLETAKELFFPAFKKFITHVKSKSHYAVMMHNCGSIYEFIPSLIDCGIDILNPVQFTAKNMEPRKLKEEFGKDLCFWGGGVDTQRVLPFGTEDEVRKQVRENAKIFSEGSGYVFNPVHCIQAHVPPENIVAAFQEINTL